MVYGSPGLANDYPRKSKVNVVRWVVPGWGSTNVANGGQLVQNQIRYTPIFVEETTLYIRIGCDVVQSAIGVSTLDIRIFADANGLPGALILDCGNVDTQAAPGFREIVIAQTLTRGYYWLAYRTAINDICILRALSAAASPLRGSYDTQGMYERPCSIVVGAWADPAPAPTAVQSAAYAASLWLREN